MTSKVDDAYSSRPPANARRGSRRSARTRAGSVGTAELAGRPRIDIDIRRLTYGDLPQVIAIERRSFPAPWSLAMFVLELSKPSSVCLGAIRGDELIGYLVCSR